MPVLPGAGAGAGAVSWLCTCCKLAAHVVETGCWCLWRVPVLALGAGCWWWCCELAVHVVDRLLAPGAGAGAGAGCRCWWCSLHICGDLFCPDSKAMGFILQITMSCLRAFETGCRCWWAVETGCRCWVPVPGAGGAGAGCWQCAW